MKRFLAGALASLLLVAGCSAPAPEENPPNPQPAPPPVERPDPSPPSSVPGGAPEAAPAYGGILVRGVQEEYCWFAGGQRVAAATEAGLWSLQPGGGSVDLLAPAGPPRRLVGAFADGVVYLEQQPDAIAAFIATPGKEPQQVGRVKHQPAELQAGYPAWSAISGSRLIIAPEGLPPIAIDLATGESAPLISAEGDRSAGGGAAPADEAIPVAMGDLALSRAGQYLAYKRANRADPVRVVDLRSGALSRPGAESHLPGIAWSPAGDRWAVRAAEPGSGLPVPVGADMVEGATHLDVSDAMGGLSHLTPPYDLELIAGPWWSGDGRYLAVVQGDLERPEATRRLWIVDVGSNEWLRIGALPEDGFVAGLAPDKRSLMVYGPNGRLRLWPVDGSAPAEVVLPWAAGPNTLATLPDGGLLYISAEPQSRLLLQLPGGAAEPLMPEAEAGPKGRLSLQGDHVGLILYRDGSADLLLLPLPR